MLARSFVQDTQSGKLSSELEATIRLLDSELSFELEIDVEVEGSEEMGESGLQQAFGYRRLCAAVGLMRLARRHDSLLDVQTYFKLALTIQVPHLLVHHRPKQFCALCTAHELQVDGFLFSGRLLSSGHELSGPAIATDTVHAYLLKWFQQFSQGSLMLCALLKHGTTYKKMCLKHCEQKAKRSLQSPPPLTLCRIAVCCSPVNVVRTQNSSCIRNDMRVRWHAKLS